MDEMTETSQKSTIRDWLNEHGAEVMNLSVLAALVLCAVYIYEYKTAAGTAFTKLCAAYCEPAIKMQGGYGAFTPGLLGGGDFSCICYNREFYNPVAALNRTYNTTPVYTG